MPVCFPLMTNLNRRHPLRNVIFQCAGLHQREHTFQWIPLCIHRISNNDSRCLSLHLCRYRLYCVLVYCHICIGVNGLLVLNVLSLGSVFFAECVFIVDFTTWTQTTFYRLVSAFFGEQHSTSTIFHKYFFSFRRFHGMRLTLGYRLEPLEDRWTTM